MGGRPTYLLAARALDEERLASGGEQAEGVHRFRAQLKREAEAAFHAEVQREQLERRISQLKRRRRESPAQAQAPTTPPPSAARGGGASSFTAAAVVARQRMIPLLPAPGCPIALLWHPSWHAAAAAVGGSHHTT